MKTHSLEFLDNKGKKAFAQTFINHKENHLHQINSVIICSYLDVFITVNKQTLKFNYHDTERIALDHVLDYYNVTRAEQKQFNL